MNEATQDQVRDILRVLDSIISQSRVQLTDSALAAMSRLRESAMTETERSAEALKRLRWRRTDLVPRRIELADVAQSWEFAASHHKIPQERDRARTRADKAAADLKACVSELATVEAEIAKLEAA